jgi:hypothetical protein
MGSEEPPEQTDGEPVFPDLIADTFGPDQAESAAADENMGAGVEEDRGERPEEEERTEQGEGVLRDLIADTFDPGQGEPAPDDENVRDRDLTGVEEDRGELSEEEQSPDAEEGEELLGDAEEEAYEYTEEEDNPFEGDDGTAEGLLPGSMGGIIEEEDLGGEEIGSDGEEGDSVGDEDAF